MGPAMTEHISLLSASETAYVLRRCLGPHRAWSSFLADCLRYEQDLHGYRLLPHSRYKGRAPRPLYLVADIGEFIKSVKTANPSLGPTEPQTIPYLVSGPSGSDWRLRTATPATPRHHV